MFQFYHLGMVRVNHDSVKVLSGQCPIPRGPTPHDMEIALLYGYGDGKKSYLNTLHRLGEEMTVRELLRWGWQLTPGGRGRGDDEIRAHWEHEIRPLMEECGVTEDKITPEFLASAFSGLRVQDESGTNSPNGIRAINGAPDSGKG